MQARGAMTRNNVIRVLSTGATKSAMNHRAYRDGPMLPSPFRKVRNSQTPVATCHWIKTVPGVSVLQIQM